MLKPCVCELFYVNYFIYNRSEYNTVIFFCVSAQLIFLDNFSRSMTGREFFSRFPELHSFLLSQLQAACHGIDRLI